MKKLAAVIILSLAALFPAYSAMEFWMGAAFYADYNELSPSVRDRFPAMADEVNEVRSLGLSVDFAFFPWNNVRIGIVGASHTMLPIGYTPAGGAKEGFISYDFDLREDLSIGIGYYQFFTPMIGMFLSGSFQYTWYRNAAEHVANESAPMDYVMFSDMGILAEAGIVTRSENMFFRLGFSFSYDMLNKPAGFRIGILAGGGFIIGGKN